LRTTLLLYPLDTRMVKNTVLIMFQSFYAMYVKLRIYRMVCRRYTLYYRLLAMQEARSFICSRPLAYCECRLAIKATCALVEPTCKGRRQHDAASFPACVAINLSDPVCPPTLPVQPASLPHSSLYLSPVPVC